MTPINRLQRGELYERLQELHQMLDTVGTIISDAYCAVDTALRKLQDQDYIDAVLGPLAEDSHDNDDEPPRPARAE